MKTADQKGVSLLLTLLITAAILVIALGVSRISIKEIKLTRDISKSVIAYYGADSGIERAVYDERVKGGAGDISDCIDDQNQICYTVQVGGVSPNKTISSKGSYKDIRRAIEVSF